MDGNLVNIKDGRVIDVSSNNDKEDQNVIVFKKHNRLNQQWDIIYLDQLKPELTIGDFYPEFGMYVGKEFSIVSNLGK